jgi:hypothetical protein
MKILLDENVPTKVKFDFGKDYTVKTLRDMKWLGKKNGELMKLMTSEGFDFFITLDKNLKFQQNLKNYEVNVILLNSKDNKHQTLQPFITKVKTLLLNGKFQKFNEITK